MPVMIYFCIIMNMMILGIREMIPAADIMPQFTSTFCMNILIPTGIVFFIWLLMNITLKKNSFHPEINAKT